MSKKMLRRIGFFGGYDKEFYDYTYNKYSKFSYQFTKILFHRYKINTLIDVGCGNGLYLKRFMEFGVDVLGIESSRSAIKYSLISKDKIIRHNLQKNISINKKFDMCTSFEVAEHLKADYAKHFVRLLISFSKLVVFSAACSGQGGYNHYNEQPKSYWKNLFSEEGYYHGNDEVNYIRNKLEETNIELKDIYPYLNLMIFRK